jgi:Na+-translocating ferredoxin:NAD+ oxidoreductase RnfD subunit
LPKVLSRAWQLSLWEPSIASPAFHSFLPGKWGAVLSLIFTGAEVLGRFFLVMTGVAPSRGPDLAKIIVGAVIAVCVMIYIGWQYFWKPTSN